MGSGEGSPPGHEKAARTADQEGGQRRLRDNVTDKGVSLAVDMSIFSPRRKIGHGKPEALGGNIDRVALLGMLFGP